MALKGKKKSRSRGSQARRRPGAAPRPSYGGREKPRWYETTTGLVLAFVGLVTVGILIWWFVADSRNEARELEATQESLQSYTNGLDGLIANLTPVGTGLSTAGELEDEQLTKKTKEWTNQLASAQTAMAQMTPPEGLEPLSGLMSQAVLLYVQSTELYALLPELEGKTRDEVAARAMASLQAGSNIFAGGLELLDAERQANEMTSSGLTAPGAPPEGMAPTGQIPVPGGDEAEQGDG